MTNNAHDILPINLADEMKQSYLDYAMSVIVGRALPDVRDGLKPVHRRVLYTMNEQGNYYNKPHKKSANPVGQTMSFYHPHGDSAIYDTVVRMAQTFSMRHILIDGQGNFGSVDGDRPAQMRYTEVRMSKFAHEILADIDKRTVDFVPNYDDSTVEPTVLPTRIPNLLVNGSSGIAVGMATNIPTHNLGEVINACVALLENPEASIADLMTHIAGPDFPTAGIINGSRGIKEAYLTGRGRIYVRARAHFEEFKKGREAIIVTELPYQVNKARLQERIGELVREKRLTGISAMRDESDKDGMRIVIELKRGESTEVVLNQLYKNTAMENVFGINMVALIDGRPRVLNLKEIVEAFLRHRREVVTRRTIFDLQKARERAHVLEGQAIALANIDEVIALIKSAPTPAEAKIKLIERFWTPGLTADLLSRAGEGGEATRPKGIGGVWGLAEEGYKLSAVQAQAILDLRLHRLTGLEQDKILSEYKALLETIADLLDILSSADRLQSVIREELIAVKEEYADERRTEIVENYEDVDFEDLITEEDMLVTFSHTGYAKRQATDTYQAQHRGGRGKAATQVKDEDFIEQLFVANTHDTLLCFSSAGKVYWLKVYQLPEAGRGARGKPMINLLPLDKDERIHAVLPIRDYNADKFVFMATRSGTVKKTSLEQFSRPRTNGIIAVNLKDDDDLVGVAITDGSFDIMLLGSHGKAIRFDENDVREMGRTAGGVRGIKLPTDDHVVALLTFARASADLEDAPLFLTATEHGYGKRSRLSEFSQQNRGGQGVIAIQTSDRNGRAVGAVLVEHDDEMMLISQSGTLVRTAVDEVSIVGRNAQGVRLIRLQDGDRLVGLDKIEADDAEDIEEA